MIIKTLEYTLKSLNANNKTTEMPLRPTIHVSFFSIWLLMINQFTQQPTLAHLSCYPINMPTFCPDIFLIVIISAFQQYGVDMVKFQLLHQKYIMSQLTRYPATLVTG